jgi:hypothetical protein
MDHLEIIERDLPWGLHDALLVRFEVDWLQSVARMDLRIAMTESQDQDRLGQLTFDGLLFCAMEAPEVDKARGYMARTPDGLQIDPRSRLERVGSADDPKAIARAPERAHPLRAAARS